MGSVNNFPYQAVLGNNELWILQNEPSENDRYISGLKGNPGYTPDPRASAEFFAKALRKNSDDQIITEATPIDAAGNYYRIDNNSPGIFTVGFYDVNDEFINAAVIADIPVFPQNKGTLTWQRYNFYIVVDDTQPEKKVKASGIAAEYNGTYDGNRITGVIAAPFNQIVTNILNNVVEIRELSNFYGRVVTELGESDGFKITNLPSSVFSKNVHSGDAYYERVIPINEDYDDYFKNIGLVGWTVAPSFMGWWSGALGSPQAMGLSLVDFYSDIGSDMLRKTADGKFYNGIDMATETLAYGGATASNPYKINFTGGSINIYYQNTYGNSGYYIVIKNSQGQNVTTPYNLPCSADPGRGFSTSGGTAIYNVYLCKHNSDYYLMGLWAMDPIKDPNGNIIKSTNTYYGNYWDEAIFYELLYKFPNEAAELLENGTETIIEYDPEHIDENSPEASTGDDQSKNYDRESQWRRGEGAGSNEGIRHNGSEIINGSDLEQTAADETPHASSPPESGQGRIPTPLNSGAIKAFVISDPDVLADFMSELNSDDFGTKLTKYFSNPMDVFISLHRCIAPAITPGASKYLTYGLWHSQHSLPVLDQEMYDVNMGFINLGEITNSFKDYPPFCQYYIYLPYIGIKPIDGKLVAGKELNLYYHINVLTGDIPAELRMYNAKSGHNDTCYYWTGNTLASMPLKSTDYSSMISGLIGTVIGAGAAVATGNPLGMLSALSGLKGAVHPDIDMIGSVTGSTTFALPSQPYIIRVTPQESNKYPENYNRLQGRPSNIGSVIAESTSPTSNHYIIFSESDLSTIKNNLASATEDELLEVQRLLREGVYV